MHYIHTLILYLFHDIFKIPRISNSYTSLFQSRSEHKTCRKHVLWFSNQNARGPDRPCFRSHGYQLIISECFCTPARKTLFKERRKCKWEWQIMKEGIMPIHNSFHTKKNYFPSLRKQQRHLFCFTTFFGRSFDQNYILWFAW